MASSANALFAGRAHQLLGDAAAARAAFDLARDELERVVAAQPDDRLLHMNLGLAYAGLGRADEAADAVARGSEMSLLVGSDPGGPALRGVDGSGAELGSGSRRRPQSRTPLQFASASLQIGRPPPSHPTCRPLPSRETVRSGFSPELAVLRIVRVVEGCLALPLELRSHQENHRG